MDEKQNSCKDWRSLTIYQVMVGSFLHGEGGTDGYKSLWGPDGERKDGSLRGVINALDHIVRRGATGIWLTPIFDSTGAEGGEQLQGTGYFSKNYFKVDPHFGTENDLKELVEKAHDRGLYVFLDGVFGYLVGNNTPVFLPA